MGCTASGAILCYSGVGEVKDRRQYGIGVIID